MKRFSILFVCMGNICRSPLAEGIFAHVARQARLADRFKIDSAGLGGWHQGAQPDKRSIAIAKTHGIDITGQRARRIRLEDFEQADLILAMDRSNMAALHAMAPEASNIELFAEFALQTGEDIQDPYYGGLDGFEQVYARLLTGCIALVGKLGADQASLSGNTSSVR